MNRKWIYMVNLSLFYAICVLFGSIRQILPINIRLPLLLINHSLYPRYYQKRELLLPPQKKDELWNISVGLLHTFEPWLALIPLLDMGNNIFQQPSKGILFSIGKSWEIRCESITRVHSYIATSRSRGGNVWHDLQTRHEISGFGFLL